ncbi:hypothetical protein [Amycolatopsis alkalitolerans]|uniref:hypothetical protein n=1 Tax=Amycolatopsis alkalitolerans TaxID=2547244 RepID=UPI00135A4337|nr:hypothetical protein [Amycolatopsis alkalitolerans]
MWKQWQGGASSSTAAPVSGPTAGTGGQGWHPTVLYMLGLVVAEIVIVGILSRHLLK